MIQGNCNINKIMAKNNLSTCYYFSFSKFPDSHIYNPDIR